MAVDYTSYESMLAAREAANWAFWSMLVTAGGLLVSILTLYVATKAIHTWKKQEILKIKMDFKKSLMRLKTECYLFPEYVDVAKISYGQQFINADWNLTDIDRRAAIEAQRYNQFNQAFLSCCDSWVATERLFDNSEVSKGWDDVVNGAQRFVHAEISSKEFQQIIHNLYSKNFVFE
ncbi:hypothetical protein A3460_05405 [Enterobacter roggenkampii]|uniref:hypothetical protein n=1 Tax=Enterobacter roggenkampii TaxID=1812935 RepID=UPI0007B320DD|nr:hypothetical protein [Enterobacter roggenkampii]KZP80136.1 hypothetical protein A3460_05405 [Enterobacter roggenkampii]